MPTGASTPPFTDHVKKGTTFLFPITQHAADVEAVVAGKASADDLANDQISGLFN